MACGLTIRTAIDGIVDDIEPVQMLPDSTKKNLKKKVPLQLLSLEIIEQACSSLAVTCVSSSARQLYSTVPRLQVLKVLSFLNECLVPANKFVHQTREKCWCLYHQSYPQHIAEMLKITRTPSAAAWICLDVFQRLLESNYPLSSSSTIEEGEVRELDEEGKDIVKYIGGSIVSKLQRRNGPESEVVECLQQFVGERSEGLTATLDRGGLIHLCHEAQKFFCFLETKAAICLQTAEQTTLGDFEQACSEDVIITSSFEGIVYASNPTTQTKDRLFNQITQLYFKIRVHHECRMFRERLAQKSNSVQKKGLRKTLQQQSC